MALGAGYRWPGGCELAELGGASSTSTQPQRRSSSRAVGHVAHIAGGVLQRRWRLGSLLSGYARPGRRGAGGSGGGGTVGRLPGPGLARVAFAPDTCGCSQLAVIHTVLYPDWSHWLAPTIAILCLAAAASLVAARPKRGLKVSGYPLAAISVGILSLFLAPSIWAASTMWYGAETRSPTAGPQAKPTETSSTFPGNRNKVARLVDYLQANQGDATYLVAAIRSDLASPIILNT